MCLTNIAKTRVSHKYSKEPCVSQRQSHSHGRRRAPNSRSHRAAGRARTDEQRAVLADEEHGGAAQQQADGDRADRVVHGQARHVRRPGGHACSGRPGLRWGTPPWDTRAACPWCACRCLICIAPAPRPIAATRRPFCTVRRRTASGMLVTRRKLQHTRHLLAACLKAALVLHLLPPHLTNATRLRRPPHRR
jgi:hypothetical protein